jgi:hypothetical protein
LTFKYFMVYSFQKLCNVIYYSARILKYVKTDKKIHGPKWEKNSWMEKTVNVINPQEFCGLDVDFRWEKNKIMHNFDRDHYEGRCG